MSYTIALGFLFWISIGLTAKTFFQEFIDKDTFIILYLGLIFLLSGIFCELFFTYVYFQKKLLTYNRLINSGIIAIIWSWQFINPFDSLLVLNRGAIRVFLYNFCISFILTFLGNLIGIYLSKIYTILFLKTHYK